MYWQKKILNSYTEVLHNIDEFGEQLFQAFVSFQFLFRGHEFVSWGIFTYQPET
jgi:hypothetical protein